MARSATSPATRGETAHKPKRSLDEVRTHFGWRRLAECGPKQKGARSRLSPEDQIVQSMADASPAKWHRAHVTWFFEQFLLVPSRPGLQDFRRAISVSVQFVLRRGRPAARAAAARLITRPNGEDVAAYRAHVDAAVERLIDQVPATDAERVFAIVEIGLHHEQQHQELLITDILHAFAQNPTDPVYDPDWQLPAHAQGPRGYVAVPSGHSCHRP